MKFLFLRINDEITEVKDEIGFLLNKTKMLSKLIYVKMIFKV